MTHRDRRAAQKRARLEAPAPVRLPDYDGFSIEQLRDLRRQLGEEEGRVSYWRRIIQARIDLIETGVLHGGATVEGLSRVLREHTGSSRRVAYLPVQPAAGSAPMPELELLWDQVTDGSDNDTDLRTSLVQVERELSGRRAALHTKIDEVTGQLIARYREEPTLALSALPQRATTERSF